jgi:CheY-like chemotaxis protein
MGQSKRVLVADDEDDVLQFVSLVLEDAGFSVGTARDGFETLKKIEAESPDLVVLDLMMPGLDGWQVLTRLRHDLKRPRIVVLSAFADSAQASAAGATACLAKPFLAGELVRTCVKTLGA